jgi:hypothetical protein
MAIEDDIMAGITELLTRLPDATPGAAGGVLIAGANAATEFVTDSGPALFLHTTDAAADALALVGTRYGVNIWGDVSAALIHGDGAGQPGVSITSDGPGLLLSGISITGSTSGTGLLTTGDGIRKGVSVTWPFWMMNSTDHVTPQDGLTVTAIRSIDGGAFDTATNAVAEISDGGYKILLDGETDLDGDTILLMFTATGADPQCFIIKTSS